ncbi:MAG: hypothetical protein REI09_05330 [Candidatus Dactylopiibacterium sp.]|nr:hypothetical protein [Candidatus Dactylopiibacterium sp.]
MSTNRTIKNLRQRLERWELGHLRELAAAHAEEVERLQDELDRARSDARCAEHIADMYRAMAEEPGAYTPALTINGQIGLVNARGH